MNIDLRKCPTDILRHASAIIHAEEDQVVRIEIECQAQAEEIIAEIYRVLDGVIPDELDAEIRRRAN